MSALADALVAAQRRALAAMEKQYVAGKIEAEAAHAIMNDIGLTDEVDQERLVEALEIIRRYGAAIPAESTNGAASKAPEPATDAQLALIAELVQRHQVAAPDLPLTKQEASTIISALKAGTYDPMTWRVPF